MKDPNLRTIVVPVSVTVNVADYELAYGDVSDIEEYTATTVRDAADQALKRVGWGTASTER